MRFCSYCYLETQTLLKCGKCEDRLYCSKECQTLDWKNAGHQFYCGKAGEIDVDFEIRESGDKGLGMFARRKFQRNDLIMVERPIFTMESESIELPLISETAQHAVQALAPVGGSVLFKVMRNRMSISDDEAGESGLFLTMSRINHHCHGSADPRYMKHHGAKILVARCDIEPNEEICIPYTSFQPRLERQQRLSLVYGFDCTCTACSDDSFEELACQVLKLDHGLMIHAAFGGIESALLQGTALIAIYDELSYSSWSYNRTYYDLFQVAISKEEYSSLAPGYAEQAKEAVLAYCGGDTDEPNVRRYQKLMVYPEKHRNYLMCDYDCCIS